MGQIEEAKRKLDKELAKEIAKGEISIKITEKKQTKGVTDKQMEAMRKAGLNPRRRK
jgi:hypothetical protein